MLDLMKIQETLEADMVSAGAARYEEQRERGLSNVGPGEALRKRAYVPMVTAIGEACHPAKRGRGREKRGLKYIRTLDADILADLAIRRILDCAAKRESLIKTAKAIAGAVEWHVKDESLHAAAVSIWNKTQERLAKTQSPRFRRLSIDGTVKGIRRWAEENAPDLAERLEDVRGVDWDIETQIEVGTALIDLFAVSTGLIVVEEERRSRNQSKAIVRFSEGTEEWLREKDEYHKMLRPVMLPMVVPPRDWTAMDKGGYLDSEKARVGFIKTNAKSLGFEDADMQDAYDAVNAIQRTAWRVNLPILMYMTKAWEAGSGIGDVPARYYEDGERALPALPMRCQDMTPEQRKKDPEAVAIMAKRRDIHEYNAELRTKVKEFGDLMGVAQQFSQYPEFYHPHKLDWRQRAYPVSVFLSPQGDQFNKGLIEFAEGKRMGDSENSGAWLAIHGANCYGVDKVSFEDRIAWVEENHDLICDAAMLPLDSPFWQKADKPWPFLAFCMEWLAYSIAGDDHITHLPVALDGSNSGLQHLSAMLRDERGAQITCVKPGTTPEDVYQMVADQVERELATMDDEWAAIWRGKVTRKVVKQPTMTYTYSATESGMRDQIKSALSGLDCPLNGPHLSFTDKTQSNASAASFLAPIVRAAIATQMQKAAEAMQFLQDIAKTYSKTGLPLRWTTPLGVPVLQYYPTSASKRKSVFINGSRHWLRINVDSPDKLNKRRAVSGVSPNFVHSMDSTHLLWTVLYCADNHDIGSFAMIHDSFGTHATNCDALAAATREMFVTLYSEDRLTDLRNQTAKNLELVAPELVAELPDVPEFGTFDINTVRDSDYFFA